MSPAVAQLPVGSSSEDPARLHGTFLGIRKSGLIEASNLPGASVSGFNPRQCPASPLSLRLPGGCLSPYWAESEDDFELPQSGTFLFYCHSDANNTSISGEKRIVQEPGHLATGLGWSTRLLHFSFLYFCRIFPTYGPNLFIVMWYSDFMFPLQD